jgi:hypothetical protein
MNDIVKTCVNCGPLTEEKVIRRTNYGKPIIKCKHCNALAGRKHYFKKLNKPIINNGLAPEAQLPIKRTRADQTLAEMSFIKKSKMLLLQAELDLSIDTDLRVQIEALQNQIHNLQHQPPKGKISSALKKARQLERNRDYARRSSLHLNDTYVKRHLVHNMKLPKEIINEDIIETFRAQMKITRKIKELKEDGNK